MSRHPPAAAWGWAWVGLAWVVLGTAAMALLGNHYQQWLRAGAMTRAASLGIYWAAYCATWKKAVRAGENGTRLLDETASGLWLACSLWLTLLTVFQWVMLLLGVAVTLLTCFSK